MKKTQSINLRTIAFSGLAIISITAAPLLTPALTHAAGGNGGNLTYSPPSQLVPTAVYNNGTHLIDTSWTPDGNNGFNLGDTVSYTLQIRAAGGPSSSWTSVAGTSGSTLYNGTATSFSIGGTMTGSTYTALTSGTSYDIEVSELDTTTSTATGWSYVSSVVFGTANGSTVTEASKPTISVMNVDASGSGFDIGWATPSTVGTSPITGYELNIVSSVDGSTTEYTPAISSTATSYDLTSQDGAGVTPFVSGVKYYFQVAALTAPTDDSANIDWTDAIAGQAGGEGATGPSTPTTPKAPDTAVQRLILANPLTVLAFGVIAAATVVLTGRRLVKTTK